MSFSPKSRNFCSFCVESGSVLHVINTPCRHRKGYVMFRYSLYRMLIEAFLYTGKGFSGIQEKGFKDTEQTKYWYTMHCTYRQINGIKFTDGCTFASERFSATYHYTYFPFISTIPRFSEIPASAYMSHLSSSLFL